MKKSRVIAWLIVFAMLLSWIVVPESYNHVHAAEENDDMPTITVGNVEGKPGDTVLVPVSISNNPGITLLNTRVQFDDAAVTVVNSRNNPDGPLGKCTYMASQKDGTNPVTMYWESGLEDFTGDGTIGYVEVTIKADAAPGEYEVFVVSESFEAYNTAWESIVFDLVSGTITVLCPEHDFPAAYTSDNNATCTADGTMSRTCSICGETETVTDPGSRLGHSFTSYIGNGDAACETDGTETAVCDRCDATDTRTAAGSALGHSFTSYAGNGDATCEADGTETAKCDRCDATDTRTAAGSKLDHSFTEYVSNGDATCETDGTETAVCDRCDATDTRTDVGSREDADHSFPAEYTSDGNAACTVDGTKSRVCDLCGEKETVTDVGSALGHTEGAAVVENEIPASCGEDGSYDSVVSCVTCGEELSRETIVVPATGDHNYATETRRVEPTCTADGYVIMACGCGATEKTVLPATGHNPGETVVENKVEATCTTDGGYDEVVYCTVCDEELSRNSVVVPAFGHNPGETVVENKTEASCGEDGSYDNVVYCQTCDAELSRETIVVPATGDHNYATETRRVEPTCTADGYVIMACGCGATEKTVLPATGHTAGETVIENKVEATCTTDGGYDEVVYCTVCDEELSRNSVVVPAFGHNPGETVIENKVEATCVTDGGYDEVVYCTVCGTELSRNAVVVPATGTHNYATETERVEATCTADGYVIMACGCGATETTVLPATGHNPGETVVENKVEATCVTDGGYDEVVYCTVCGTELSRNAVVVPATGTHNYATETERVEATCTADGYVIMACGCGATEKTVLPATGHNPGETVIENKVEATCTTDGGYDEVVCCTVCDEELSRNNVVVPAPGHTAGETVIENKVEATCTADGGYDEVVSCVVCGIELSRSAVVIPATGDHDYATETERVDATCTVDGYVTMACGCGETQTTVLIAGHTAGETVVENEVKATCTADGSYDEAVYCTVCSAEIQRQVVVEAATGHDWSGDDTCASCGAENPDKKPVSNAPATGDDAAVMMYVMLMMFSAAALVFCGTARRKLANDR